MTSKNKLVVFADKNIRRIWFNDEWWFVIKDVIQVLTESQDPTQYLKKLRQRDESLNAIFKGGGQIVPPLTQPFKTEGGTQKMLCWNTKGIFRLIQSIPSPRAESFKQWLAQVGYERIEEIENPELAQNRAKVYYELKGYPKEWIDKRLRGIAIRQELTDEWKNRGVIQKKDFAILTNEIHTATFEMPISQHKTLKEIPQKSKINLRDHMTDLELIFSMLGERATTEITQVQDLKGFENLQTGAKKGGNIAKNARVELEAETGKRVISKSNYLQTEKRQIK